MTGFLKRLLFVLPFVLLALTAVLTFFQHPSADDFTCNFFVNRYGFIGANKFFFAHGTGRYASIPLILLLESSRFLFDHCYIVLLTLMALTYCCVYFFLGVFIKALLDIHFSSFKKHWLTACGVLLFAGSIPEIGSFFFWMGTGIVYLLSFLLFLVYLVLLYRRFFMEKTGWVNSFLLVITIIMLCGLNELSMYYSAGTLAIFFFYRLFFLKKAPVADIAIFLFHCILVVLVFLIPGNHERSAGYAARQPFVYSLVGSIYQVFQIFSYIFSSSFFWMAWAGVILLAGFLKPAVKEMVRTKKTSFLVEILVLLLLMIVLITGIRHMAGHIIPQRGKNIIVCITIIGLLLVTLLNVHRLSVHLASLEFIQRNRRLLYVFALLFLVFNSFSGGLVQSLINSPIHNEILKSRIATINSAKQNGARKITVSDYQQEFLNFERSRYSAKVADFMHAEFPGPPRFLYFVDDPASGYAPYYAEYYGIDTVIKKGVSIPRIGLMWRDDSYKLDDIK